MECQVNEVYPCLMGESLAVGLKATLVRLAGCNLHCRYCDTRYATSESGVPRTIESLIEEIARQGFGRMLLTGGEPMLQKEPALQLMERCVGESIDVHLETNGSLPLSEVPKAATKVVDIKTPGAKSGGVFLLDNLSALNAKDQLKFVITSKEDFRWSEAFIKEHSLAIPESHLLFSPAFGDVDPKDLADWVLASPLDIRLHIQIHKTIWGEKRGV